MADKKEKKGFAVGAYAGIAGVIIAVVLVGLTIFAFTTRYTAFSPEKTAQYYVDVIVQSGDGYNAYKNTLVSKNQKYGDYVINAYMAPYVNKKAEQNSEIGTGSQKEIDMLNTVYDTMYEYYEQLVTSVGFDNYDAFYNLYFAKLKDVRTAVLGDDYMDTEFMFSVFESNVDRYGKSLTGVEEEYQADGETIKTPAQVGKYQEMYGNDYKFVTTVTETKTLSDEECKEYIAQYKDRIMPVVNSAEVRAEALGIENTVDEKGKEVNTKDAFVSANEKLNCSDDIDEVAECTVSVDLENGENVTSVKVFVVKIGNSWYVDNTNVDTSVLYLAK